MHWLRRLVEPLLTPLGSPRPRASHRGRSSSPAAVRARTQRAKRTFTAARAAMAGTFVVADLETTGLARSDEILEIAALRATASGVILEEYSALVRIRRSLSPEIQRLTGISQRLLEQKGIPLSQALPAYLRFCRSDPVFFHNAGFDRRFLLDAASKRALSFENPVLCTLTIARAAWPELSSHTLQALAKHIGTPLPTHRALADVKATLSILLAACPPPR